MIEDSEKIPVDPFAQKAYEAYSAIIGCNTPWHMLSSPTQRAWRDVVRAVAQAFDDYYDEHESEERA